MSGAQRCSETATPGRLPVLRPQCLLLPLDAKRDRSARRVSASRNVADEACLPGLRAPEFRPVAWGESPAAVVPHGVGTTTPLDESEDLRSLGMVGREVWVFWAGWNGCDTVWELRSELSASHQRIPTTPCARREIRFSAWCVCTRHIMGSMSLLLHRQ